MRLDPAHGIIMKCGGYARVAGITGKSLTRVYRWTYPKNRGGTGGVIPTNSARRLLEWAQREGIALAAADFLAAPRKAAA